MTTPVTLQSKNPATITLFIKMGVDPSLNDLQNATFDTVIFPDGTELQNATFAQLQNTLWSYAGKNQTTMTDVLKP